MRLSTTLAAGAIALTAAALIAAALAAGWVIRRTALADVHAELERARAVVGELHRYRQALFRAQADLVAEDARLKAVLATRDLDPETLQDVVAEVRGDLAADLFIVTDKDGAPIAAEPTTVPSLATAALRERQASGFWTEAGQVYQAQARTLDFERWVLGVVVVGYRSDAAVLESIARQTGAVVGLVSGGQVLASSGTPLAPGMQVDVHATSLTLDGAEHLAATVRVSEDPAQPRYLLVRSLHTALEPSRRLTGALLWILGFGVLAAASVSVVLARRIAAPIAALARLTDRIGAGDLKTRAPETGVSEVRELGGALNRMSEELARSRKAVADKERLEREVEIARTLQTSVLPTSLSLEGFEVGAVMLPATEVGGDYYDVLPQKGGGWLAVGDVSGHGLAAGVVMLILQNVVSAATRAHPEAGPAQVLCLLNDVLHELLRQRMKRLDYATCVLVSARPDGRITLAGAHEELLILRAATQTIERIEVEGTWLGPLKEIRRFTREQELKLDPGDLLVAYTDGITEARSATREQFGLERLEAVIRAASSEPAQALCDRVIAAARSWAAVQDDDMTIVVARHRGA